MVFLSNLKGSVLCGRQMLKYSSRLRLKFQQVDEKEVATVVIHKVGRKIRQVARFVAKIAAQEEEHSQGRI